MTINRFEDLEIWKEARILSSIVKSLTDCSPFCTDFRFKDQIKAASGSVMDNIAEGFERDGNKEFLQFLSISKGSCGEVRSQSYRAFDFGYITQQQLDELIFKTEKLSNMIGSFIVYLRKSEFKGRKYK